MSAATPATEVPRDEPTPQVDEVIAEVVETYAFNQVPEHSGKLRDLIDKHTNGEGECPYITSMGAAGIELVERLAESAADPDRGPTMRELMAAEAKQEAEAAKLSESAEEDKRAASFNLESALSSTAETKSEAPVANHLDQRLMDHVIAEELSKRSAEQTSPYVDIVESADSQSVEPNMIIPEPSKPVLIAETAPVAVAVPKPEEISKPVEVFSQPLIAEQSSKTIDTEHTPTALFERRKIEGSISAEHAPIEVPGINGEPVKPRVVDAEPIEPTQEISDEPVSLVVSEQIPEEVEDTESSELEELLSRVTEVYADAFEDIEEDDSPILASEAETDSGELAPDLYLTEAVLQSEDTEVNPTQPDQESAVANINQEFTTYIETLEPNKADVVAEALQAFVEAVSRDQELPEDAEPQKRLVQLLESIGLDYEDEKTKKIAESILEPLMRAKASNRTGLTIDQLNNMGTREYKASSISDVITNLRQFIKQHAQLRLRLGIYATSLA